MAEEDIEQNTAAKKGEKQVSNRQDVSIEEQPEVAQEFSAVASNPKQGFILLGVIGLAFIYVMYTFFLSNTDSNQKEVPLERPDNVGKPIQIDSDSDIPPIPTLPTPPKLEDPVVPELKQLPSIPQKLGEESNNLPAVPEVTSLPELPPTAPSLPSGPEVPVVNTPTLPPLKTPASASSNKRQETKQKAPIMLINNQQSKQTPEEQEQAANFKQTKSMNLMIKRGKIIDATLESAVNSDFGGEVRAIVTRDIYSEQGRNILVPKGSRVFGKYASGLGDSYGRIGIVWDRIDLPSGYTISFAGVVVDNLGRLGKHGRVDNKLKENLTNAVLVSAFNIAFADTLDKIVKPQATSQAAAGQQSQASSIRNAVSAVVSNTSDGRTVIEKKEAICSAALAAVSDKTSTTFTQINDACNNARTSTAGGTDDAQLASLSSAINAAADLLLQVTNSTVQETQAQKSSKEAFENVSKTLKDALSQEVQTPTVTIDQGAKVKIYVNKDYVFPIDSITNYRAMK